MPFLMELAQRLADTEVGTIGVNLFLSSKAQIPAGDGPFISLIETGGTAPERTQNTISPPAYQRPRAQVVVRAKTYPVAEATARLAYDALTLRNTELSGTFYRELDPVQEPFDMGLDITGRAQVAFNVAAIKRPS